MNSDLYTLSQVARLFRKNLPDIKKMAMEGKLPYIVNERGGFVFTRESLLAHLDELIERNDRID